MFQMYYHTVIKNMEIKHDDTLRVKNHTENKRILDDYD